jgi:hypothetical protein
LTANLLLMRSFGNYLTLYSMHQQVVHSSPSELPLKTANIGMAATEFTANGTEREGVWAREAASPNRLFGQERGIHNQTTYEHPSKYSHF